MALLVACSQSGGSPDGGLGNRLTSPQGRPGQLTAVIAASDIAVGQNQRFLLALIGPDNRPVTDATVDLAFFKRTGADTAQFRSRAAAKYYASPALTAVERGVYVARADFDEAGEWGVAAGVARPREAPTEVRANFQVRDKSATPAMGDRVPTSQTLTGATADEIERFSSARPVDTSLYQLSIADALAQEKPFAVLFASPGFCTSRTCGPSVDVLQTLRDQHADRANFIHVEIYKDGRPNERGETVSAVTEWGLPSEPWLFIVDASGRLAEKFDGSITVEEAAPALARVL